MTFNVFTADIYYYITTEFDYVRCDSHSAAYGAAVLQWVEFTKVCMGKNSNRHYSRNLDQIEKRDDKRKDNKALG